MRCFSGAYAWALGKVFIQHFQSGGTFLDFDAEKVKEPSSRVRGGQEGGATAKAQASEKKPA